MSKTFIVCNAKDELVDDIIVALKRMGDHNYFRFNANHIHADYEISIYPNEADFKITDKNTGEVVTANDFVSVWYTDPDGADFKVGSVADELHNYLGSEYQYALNGILACFENRGINIISHPADLDRAANKITQQMAAKKVGFQLPGQIVTTSNHDFIKEKWSNYAILKPVHSHKVIDESDGDAELPFTEFVHEGLYEGIKDEDVDLNIHYFQERLDQIAEFRIVCFGDQSYAFKITGDYEVDWRRDMSILKFEFIEDFDVNKLCQDFLDHFNLKFGSFDLMETKDGVFFIECNSPGFFLFCDAANELKLDEKFSNYLLSS